MPDILQSKPSAEQSTFMTGIQSRSCSYSSFYQYNDECMLSTLYDSHSIFFILWLQIFIIVFQQRFFKCQVNYCEIKALQYVILCDFFSLKWGIILFLLGYSWILGGHIDFFIIVLLWGSRNAWISESKML